MFTVRSTEPRVRSTEPRTDSTEPRVFRPGGFPSLLMAIACLATTPRAQNANAPPPANGRVPVVVELFTSEGCSSCPPADKVLMDLLATQPVAHAFVLGLSEHVDYWDHLGWKDPFSDHFFTARQSDFATASGSAEVYTPQMVVDGSAGFVGSDRAAAFAAITRAAATPKSPVALDWVAGTGARALRVSLMGGAAAANADVLLALVEDGLKSSVGAGENAGHVLPHAAVTRKLTTVGHTDRTGNFTAAGVRVDVPSSWHPASMRAIVFVQSSAQPHHVIAAGSIDLR